MDKLNMRGAPIVRTSEPDAEGVETVQVPVEDDDPGVVFESDGSVTIPLMHPFARATGKGEDIAAGITKIVLREMTAGDLVDMDKGETDTSKLVHLAATLSGLPVKVLERMHFEDFAVLHAVCNDKLGKFLRISARVSSRLLVR